MGYIYELQGRVKFSQENDSMPSKDLGVPFYRWVATEKVKMAFEKSGGSFRTHVVLPAIIGWW